MLSQLAPWPTIKKMWTRKPISLMSSLIPDVKLDQYSSCYHKDNAVDLVMVRVLSRSYRVACPDSNFEGHEACYVFYKVFLG